MLFLKAMTMLQELILALQLPKLVIRTHYAKNSMQMQAYVMRGCLLKSIKATFILKMVCCTTVTKSWINPSTKFVFQKGVEKKFVIQHMTSPIKVTKAPMRKCVRISIGLWSETIKKYVDIVLTANKRPELLSGRECQLQ